MREDLCSVGDAAAILGLSPRGVRWLATQSGGFNQRPVLPAFGKTLHGWWMFTLEAVERAAAARATAVARKRHPALRLVDRRVQIDALGQLALPMAGGEFTKRRRKGQLPPKASRMAKVSLPTPAVKGRRSRRNSRYVA